MRQGRSIVAACGLVALLGGASGATPAAAANASALPASRPAKDVPAKKWAHAVCMSLGGFVTQLQQLQELMTSAYGGGVAAVDTLLGRLKAAGTPKVKNGSKIARVFQSAYSDFGDGLAQQRDYVKTLDTSSFALPNPSDVVTDLNAGVALIVRGLTDAQRKYSSGYRAIVSAFHADPACAQYKA